jgi:hypothetical protein
MIIRVGLPHRGGRLAFHAFNREYPAMVSASAFWNPKTREFVVPEASDIYEIDYALDSAGFTAMRLWQAKGKQPAKIRLRPPYGPAHCSELDVLLIRPGENAGNPCEPEIARNQAEIDYRINATATLLEGSLRVVHEWQSEYRWLTPPVPVIQGWSASDYLRSLDLMLQVWERWLPAPALIGVGSVCRRSLNHPTHGLFAILTALEGWLPSGSSLHLFGVKGSALSELKMFDFVASVDSMAYDARARIKAHSASASNSFAHRCCEMTHWMEAAQCRSRLVIGDQFRLAFKASS